MPATHADVQANILSLLEEMTKHKESSQSQRDKYWHQLNLLQIKDQIEVKQLQFRGGADPLDEYIRIRNRGGLTINLAEWRVDAGSPEQQFIFPENSLLLPCQTIQVATHGDSEYSFGSNKPIWNNRGDKARLLDPQGDVITSLIYGDKAHQSITISHIHFDGQEKYREGDEFVELVNISQDVIDLGGWRIEAVNNDATYVFADDTHLVPNANIRIYTNKVELKVNEFSFDSSTAIWNNQGGACTLLDYQDREVISYHY